MVPTLVILSSVAAFALADTNISGKADTLGTNYKINRVIGGVDAAKGEFPYQVSLQFGYPPYVSYSHICGGSIINQRWIVTAAHCVSRLPSIGQLVIRAGKHFVNSKEYTEQLSPVTDIYIHEKYMGDVSPFDIALIRLAVPFRFNNYVSPINLPMPNSIPEGKTILTGWGSVSRTSTHVMPEVLQKVILPVMDINKCRISMRLLGEMGEIDDTNVCTGPLTGKFTACSGDSGGPLVQENERGQRELVGVVSWGVIPCGAPGAPAVFVRVSAFVNWINHVISLYNY